MLPGFVIPYRDATGNVHMYFYPGYDDRGRRIYRDIVWSGGTAVPVAGMMTDGARDYNFMTPGIRRISCKLVRDLDGGCHTERFTL